jgi:hypothetical protein
VKQVYPAASQVFRVKESFFYFVHQEHRPSIRLDYTAGQLLSGYLVGDQFLAPLGGLLIAIPAAFMEKYEPPIQGGCPDCKSMDYRDAGNTWKRCVDCGREY